MTDGGSKKTKRVLVVTNDSTVFLKDGIASAFDMFGGRMTEVKNLVASLDTAERDGDKLCDVSFGVISSHFGFVPGNYVVAPYGSVMSCKEDYEKVQEKKDYLGQLDYVSKPFDEVVVCVPKDMFGMILDRGMLRDGKVTAVTNPVFRERCEARGWNYLERKGARVGSENAKRIAEIISR